MPTLTYRTRAPATTDLIRHFQHAGWIGQPRPKGRCFSIIACSDGTIHPMNLGEPATSLLKTILKPRLGSSEFLAIRQSKSKTIWLVDCMRFEDASQIYFGVGERLAHIPNGFVGAGVRRAGPIGSLKGFQQALDDGHDILFRHLTLPGWRPDGAVLLKAPKSSDG